LACVDACIQTVRRNPQMYAVIYEGFRRALVRRFPYAVFYEYDQETVIVHCVFFTSRDPDRWVRRLDKVRGRR
jgi:hypothetical protein